MMEKGICLPNFTGITEVLGVGAERERDKERQKGRERILLGPKFKIQQVVES